MRSRAVRPPLAPRKRRRGPLRRLGRRRGRRDRCGGVNCSVCSRQQGSVQPLYDERRPDPKNKIETIARDIYGAGGGVARPRARRSTCCEARPGRDNRSAMARRSIILDDPTQLGAPTGFTLHVRDISPSAGPRLRRALAGDIMTMPGLARSGGERIRLLPDGTIEGLF